MINNKKILSVITARGGSKGIPGKNYRGLMNLPLFMWSVYASVQSKYVDKTVISSNCVDCLKIYLEYVKKDEKLKNVSWIQRPDKFATDISKNEEALIHATTHSIKYLDIDPDIVINLQPTSPCRTEGLLDKCIEKYFLGNYDSLLTARKETPFVWQKINGEWEYTVDKNGCCNRKMRQSFKENEFLFHDNGNIYIMDTNILLQTKCRIGKNPYIFETDKINSLQIDEEFDFNLIENMAKAYNLKSLI